MWSISRTPKDVSEEAFWLFRLSFHYYIIVGTFLTLIIGLFVSCITKDKDSSVDPDTLNPFIHRFLPKSACDCKYQEVKKELQTLKENDVIEINKSIIR